MSTEATHTMIPIDKFKPTEPGEYIVKTQSKHRKKPNFLTSRVFVKENGKFTIDVHNQEIISVSKKPI